MQSAQHQVDHGDMNKHLGRIGTHFIVFAQPTVPVKPGECALYNPAFWEQLKALGLVRAKYHVQSKTKPRSHPVQRLATVATVNPDTTQFLATPAQGLAKQFGIVTVLYRSGRDHDGHQQTQGVHQNMPLAPLNVLARVVAFGASERCGLDALAVNAARRGVFVSARLAPHSRA